jgi:hypothetical protein
VTRLDVLRGIGSPLGLRLKEAEERVRKECDALVCGIDLQFSIEILESWK